MIGVAISAIVVAAPTIMGVFDCCLVELGIWSEDWQCPQIELRRSTHPERLSGAHLWPKGGLFENRDVTNGIIVETRTLRADPGYSSDFIGENTKAV